MLPALPSFAIVTGPAPELFAVLAENPGQPFLSFLNQACSLAAEIPAEEFPLAEAVPLEESSPDPESELKMARDVPNWDGTWPEQPGPVVTEATPLIVAPVIVIQGMDHAAPPIAAVLPGGRLEEGTDAISEKIDAVQAPPQRPAQGREEDHAFSPEGASEIAPASPAPGAAPVPAEAIARAGSGEGQAPDTERRSLPQHFTPASDAQAVRGLSSAPLAFAMQLRMAPVSATTRTPPPERCPAGEIEAEGACAALRPPRPVVRWQAAVPSRIEPAPAAAPPAARKNVAPDPGSGHGSGQDPLEPAPRLVPVVPARRQPDLPAGAAPPVPVMASGSAPPALRNAETARGAPAVLAPAQEPSLPPPAAISHIRLRLDEAPTPEGAPVRTGVDVNLMSRGSELRLAVHSSDAALNQKLRDQVGELVVSLERSGYQPGIRFEERGPVGADHNGSSWQEKHPGPDGFQGRQDRRKKQGEAAWQRQWASAGT